MTKLERRRLEMFRSVQEFGKSHRGDLPAVAVTKALDALDAVVAEVEQIASGRINAKTQGQAEKRRAREALAGQLAAIKRTSKVLALEIPGIDSSFVLPRQRSDVALLSAARAFAVKRAEFDDARFVEHGLPSVQAFARLIDAFDLAIRSRQVIKTDRAGSRVTLGDRIDRGLLIVRTLDAVISNTTTTKRDVAAAWKRARRVLNAVRTPVEIAALEPPTATNEAAQPGPVVAPDPAIAETLPR